MPTATPGPLLCLDVSSSVTGWAAFDRTGHPHAFGRIKPLAKLPSVERIDRMVSELRGIVEACRPSLAVLEWCSGRVNRRNARTAHGAGLAVLGQAQGAVRQLLAELGVPTVVVNENDWTKGKAKKTRARVLPHLVPAYRIEDDPGLDIADAIGIGLWHFARARETELLARANA